MLSTRIRDPFACRDAFALRAHRASVSWSPIENHIGIRFMKIIDAEQESVRLGFLLSKVHLLVADHPL
jgi:hypothetical protein